MGESCRHRSRGSGSPTRHEAPPIPRHRRQQPRSACSPAEKGIPALAFPLGLQTQTPRRKHANPELPFRSPPAPGAAATPAARRPGGCPGVQGRGAQTVAPQVRPAVSPPRAGPCNRDPDAPGGRPPSPAAPSPAGGWASGDREPRWGWGTFGGGAPIPVTFAGLELHAPLSVLAGGEEFLPGTLSPKKQFLGGSRSPRDPGGSCLSPSACLGGGRRSSSAPRTPPEPPGESGSRGGPARAVADAPGHGERRQRRPPVVGSTVCSTLERTTPSAAAAAPHPPPPRAPRSTTGRGDQRLKQGGPLDSRHLTSHPSHQELFPASQRLPTSDSRFPLQPPGPRCSRGGKLSLRPLAHKRG